MENTTNNEAVVNTNPQPYEQGYKFTEQPPYVFARHAEDELNAPIPVNSFQPKELTRTAFHNVNDEVKKFTSIIGE